MNPKTNKMARKKPQNTGIFLSTVEKMSGDGRKKKFKKSFSPDQRKYISSWKESMKNDSKEKLKKELEKMKDGIHYDQCVSFPRYKYASDWIKKQPLKQRWKIHEEPRLGFFAYKNKKHLPPAIKTAKSRRKILISVGLIALTIGLVSHFTKNSESKIKTGKRRLKK